MLKTSQEKIDQEQVFIATKQGYSIRFNSDNVRPTGRDTMGVKSITLRPGDSIVSALLIKDEDGSILTVTENGYGKRTRIDEYPLQARSGKGVINIRCNAKTGAVVSVLPVTEGEELMAITSSGIVIRMPLDTIALYGRATQGVIIMKVDGAEKVVSITRVQSETEEEDDEELESSSVETENNIEEAEVVEKKED